MRRLTSYPRPRSTRSGWYGDPVGHAVAAKRRVKKPSSTYVVDLDRLKFRRRGKVYEVDLKSQGFGDVRTAREVARLKKMSLNDIKKRYKTIEEY